MFSKKGQSALEYLMTYGWALVVIVIVIAALVFLIQPSQVGGNTCSTTSGILITNHQVDATGIGGINNIELALSNQTATTLGTVDVTVAGTAGGIDVTGTAQILNLGTIADNQIVLINEDFPIGTYSMNVVFNYDDRDGFARTVTSTCNGTSS